MSSNINLYAQGGAASNQPGAGSNVLGWDGTVGAGVQDITLENQFSNKNITFNTNSTGTHGSSTTKMTIIGSTGSMDGFVGIGTTSPLSLLHLYSPGANSLHSRFTNGSSTNGLLMGLDASGNAEINMQDNLDINFYTAGSVLPYLTVMGSTTPGYVGISTTTPIFQLSVGDPAAISPSPDGSILAVGTMGSGATVPNGLTNNRMFWCPSRGVFRAGGSASGEWDNTNMGDYSIGLGYGNNAWGNYSCTINKYTSATGEQAFAAGLSTNADADNSSAFGEFTRGDSYDEMVIGRYNLPCVGCSSLTWNANDPIFEIGNGTGILGLENNIMTVLKDGRTGIGLLAFPPLAEVELNVERRTDAATANATSGYFKAEDTYASGGLIIGVIGQATQLGTSGAGSGSGGRFFAGGTSANSFGVFGWAYGAGKKNYGGYFQATQIGHGVPTNYGVYGLATGGVVNYGVYGDLGLACPPCPVPPCAPCAPPTTPNYAGYFNGDVGTTTAYWVLSDSSFKENVQDITDPMSVLNQLNPKSYTYKQNENQSIQMQANTHFGLLAQELKSVLPQLVKESVHPARFDSLVLKLLQLLILKLLIIPN